MSFEYSIKRFNHHNTLRLLFHVYNLNIDTLVHADLLHIDTYYQYLADCLLSLIMHLFLLI